MARTCPRLPQFLGSAFAIFLFRQWFRGLPPNLFESAELDGANPFQQLRYVALPLARPVIAATAVFAFVGSWNDFLGPLLYLRTPDTFTVSLGMATFQGVHVTGPADDGALPSRPVRWYRLRHRPAG